VAQVSEAQKQDVAAFKDSANQHRQMFTSFPAYRVLVEHLDGMIADEDKGWEQFDKDQIDIHRGRKAALVDFRKYLRSFLDAKFVDA
jgi:hypothetical protein